MPIELEGPPPPAPTATCFDYSRQLRIENTAPVQNARDIAVIHGDAYIVANRLTVVEADSTGRIEVQETKLRADFLASAGDLLCIAEFQRLLIMDTAPGSRGK